MFQVIIIWFGQNFRSDKIFSLRTTHEFEFLSIQETQKKKGMCQLREFVFLLRMFHLNEKEN